MAVTNKDLNLTIKSKYDSIGIGAATKDINNLNKATTNLSKSQKTQLTGISSAWKSVHGAFSNVSSGMIRGLGNMFDAIFSVKTLIMSLFAGIIGKGIMAFINLNAEFERMKVTMDVLTKGHGEEWFNALNQWALDMPVSMQEVSKAFITMQAYGLTPSIKLMENLVNVASVLPESGRAITGIARAIGQIQSKTRLEGQELRQLAEWAVPGYEAVYTKIFKKISERTGKSVSELKFTMIDSSTAIKAILETMEEHFGGAAKRISLTWGGLTKRLTNYVKEFFRQIGESGGMQPLKDQLENIVNFFVKAFKSGEMQKATGFIGSSFGIIFENIFKYFQSSKLDIKNWADIFISVLEKIIYAVTILINTFSGIKFVLLLLKFTWVGVALVLNSGLYGIIWLIDKVVQSFNWAIKLIDSIPGINIVDKETFANLANWTSGLAEAQGQNLHQLGLIAHETSEDIAKTGDAIANRWGLADKVVTELRTNLAKYKATEAIAPKTPTVGGGEAPTELTGFAKEIDETMKSLTGKQAKAFKPDEEYLKWLGSVGDLTTRAKIGFLEFEQEVDKNVLKNLKTYFKDFFGSLQSGFSSTFQGILDGSLNLKEGFAAIFKTIEQAFFQMIANMAAEWVIGKSIMLVKELLFQKAVTAAVAEGEAERLVIEEVSMIKSVLITLKGVFIKIKAYAYQAAAAVYNAFAFIPIIGPMLGVAAVAGTIALIMGFAKKVASFEKGTGLEGVRQTGPAVLHKGEIVLNKKESDAYRAGATEGGQPASNNINLSFTIHSMDSEDMDRVIRKKVIPLIRSNIRDNGRAKTMIREALA